MKPHTILLTLSFLMAGPSWLCGEEWESLFDGETLTGWNGNPAFWSFKDGAITGTTTKENPTRGNTFLIYTGENEKGKAVQFGDFVLRLEYRISGERGNSGIQYRSFLLEGDHDGWRVGGYQFDISVTNTYTGTSYGEKFWGTLGARGRKTTITGSKTVETERGPREVAIREAETFADANRWRRRSRNTQARNSRNTLR